MTRASTRTVAALAGLALASGLATPAGARPVAVRPLIGGPQGGPALLPTGYYETATAAPGSTFQPLVTGLRADGNANASEAVATALSPDGKTLLVLTSGYNLNYSTPSGSPILHDVLDPTTGKPGATNTRGEWIFVYDVSHVQPKAVQRINVPNTYDGLAWDPSGSKFYVSGGIDDRIYAFANDAKSKAYVASAPFVLLGHNSNQTAPLPNYDGGHLQKFASAGISTGAVVAGIGLSADGSLMAAANFENDSVSIVDPTTRKVSGEIAFTPTGSTKPVGEFPYWIAVRSVPGTPATIDSKRVAAPQTFGIPGSPAEIYVSSQRDDEVIGVDLVGRTHEIRTGKAPNRMILSKNGDRLYVANGDADTISVIDTAHDVVDHTISVAREGDRYRGASPNALALSPDGKTLYTTLGNENAVGVIDLAARRLVGRIPTGWYPNSVTVSADGSHLYVVNAKSSSGPNKAEGYDTPAGIATNVTHKNEYNWALEKAGLLTIPIPDRNQLAYLTRLVDDNDGFSNRHRDGMMAFLRTRIKHVIYIVDENRTFDQTLGDLPHAMGDASLTLFPYAIGPNHHRLQSEFATFDQYYTSSESSGVGWNWALQGHTNDFTEKSQSVLYGNSSFNGLTYDYQETVRNQNLALPETGSAPFGIAGFPQFSQRSSTLLDPSGRSGILPGTEDPSAGMGAGDERPGATGGYIWDAALRAGKTVRDYGVNTDQTYYNHSKFYLKPSPHAFEDHLPQSPSQNTVLVDRNDPYYRSFDQEVPDQYRINEWEREFKQFVAHKNLPNLELMTIPHDHFGSFGSALDGLGTPQLQFADNDYAVGRLVADVSASPYWKDTAIVLIEDDSQSGPDHIDSHRSFAYVVSAYTRRGAIVHTTYDEVDAVRTVEDLLGTNYIGDNDANANPMSDAFTTTPNFAPYVASIPGSLCAAPVSPTLVPACKSGSSSSVRRTAIVPQLHDGAWWGAMTRGMDFSAPDRIDEDAFNRILWAGIKGGVQSVSTVARTDD